MVKARLHQKFKSFLWFLGLFLAVRNFLYIVSCMASEDIYTFPGLKVGHMEMNIETVSILSIFLLPNHSS